MRPTRGLSGAPRERRTALLSLGVMVALLAALVIYQRATAPPSEPPAASEPAAAPGQPEQMPVTKEPEVPAAAPSPQPMRLLKPLLGQRQVLKPYGDVDQSYGDYRLNTGVTYAAEAGEAVLAAASGTVTQAEQNPLDGGIVAIEHENGLMTRYLGLGRIQVAQNARVEAGAVIGQVGRPGAARSLLGTHLHLEVLLNREPTDPAAYLGK